MIERRSALTGLGLGLTAGAMAGAPASAAEIATIEAKLPPPVIGPRMNFAQAEKIMTELGLDALVVGSGVNVYHAAGLDLTSTRMGHGPVVFAVISRTDKQRLSIVAPAFLYYYTIAQDLRDQPLPAYVYTAPAEGTMPDGFAGEPKAEPLAPFKDRGIAPLDEVEKMRSHVIDRTLMQQAARSQLKFAMRKALEDAGAAKGRIGVDLPVTERAVAEAVPEASIVDADDALRRIRPVKSEMEIGLMRYAAQANADAVLEAIKTVRAGGDVRDLRASYFAAVARRGGRGVFMVIDRVSSPTFEAKFRDGQCFSIDCVSEFSGYHGDYARAVYVGEPSAHMKKVIKATAASWDAVRAMLKPGVTFADIRATGRASLKGQNTDFNISFTPHSVGLFHNDHDGSSGLPSRDKEMVLEKGMVLSVDCPLLEAGNGGSSHLEDLTLITADGGVQINDPGNRPIIV
ncbi:MAG: M24 family metallopeptidase [Rhodospirillaceae bacterium]|nr:M24 family metallopeptidase [Rhodospirillaceae bacterium]